MGPPLPWIDAEDQPATVVSLSVSVSGDAVALALGDAARFAGQRGPYGSNGRAMHVTGRLGETAFAQWAREQWEVSAVRPLYRYDSEVTKADVQLTVADRVVDVEVKAWRGSSWALTGGCLAARQLTRVCCKADAIVFTWLEDGQNDRVVLLGWLTPTDALREGQAVFDARRIAQLKVDYSALSPIESLLSEASHLEARTTLLSGGVCALGHKTLAGHCWTCVAPSPFAEGVWISAGGNHFHAPSRDWITAAHSGWPFRTGVTTRHVGDVVDAFDPCRMCFPFVLPGVNGRSG